MKNIVKAVLLISLMMSAIGCTSQLGKFTAISTNNVRGLEYIGKNRDEVTDVSEKSCTHRIYLTRVAMGIVTLGVGWFIPQFDLQLGDDYDARLTNAVDKTIKSGKKIIFDGDLLVDASIKEKNFIVPLIYGYKCIIAEGQVVSSVTRSKGFLEKK